jgi:hypothetical protein
MFGGDWLTTKQAGSLLGLTPARVRQLAHAGRLRFFINGGRSVERGRGSMRMFVRYADLLRVQEEREARRWQIAENYAIRLEKRRAWCQEQKRRRLEREKGRFGRDRWQR